MRYTHRGQDARTTIFSSLYPVPHLPVTPVGWVKRSATQQLYTLLYVFVVSLKIFTALSVVMRYIHRGQDARTTIFSSFTLYLICPKYAVKD